jgi:hypothetical protein
VVAQLRRRAAVAWLRGRAMAARLHDRAGEGAVALVEAWRRGDDCGGAGEVGEEVARVRGTAVMAD